MRSEASVMRSFMKRIEPDQNSGCWLWTGTMDSFGYGRVRVWGIKRATHLSVKLFRGEDRPDGLVLMHSCDTPTCVNPNHLSWGSQKKNITDARDRGRLVSLPEVKHGQDHGNSKVSDEDRREIYRLRKSGMIYREIGEMYGLTIPAIFLICKNERWAT